MVLFSSFVIIQSADISAALNEKVRSYTQDASRHILCPSCRVRTKLYTLNDGRRKCSACGLKFHAEKKSDATKIQQYADLLLLFCLNFTAQQASDTTGHTYQLVSDAYAHFRTLLAAQNLSVQKLLLLRTVESCDRTVHESVFCKHCRKRFRCKGRKSGDTPIFGVKILNNHQVFIDPMEDTEPHAQFPKSSSAERNEFSAYAGFLCHGKFHRFTDRAPSRDGAEQLWAWMSERMKIHHGIGKNNAGLYIKELEWKYNHRFLSPEAQAKNIVELMPENFLTSWASAEHIPLDTVTQQTGRIRAKHM